MKIKAIITGVTGMVGEGVLHECLNHSDVQEVLVINRKPCGIKHSKLKEIIHSDFFNLSPIESQLAGYSACFFCLGISSVGVEKGDYYEKTYTLTLNFAKSLNKQNTDMVFCYVSGAGTDSTEKGRVNWARVKGKTENDLMKLPFKKAYAFRPGFIKPTPGLKHIHGFYKYVNWMFPIGRALSPDYFCSMKELGLSMINIVRFGYEKQVIIGKDIIRLAKK